SFALVSPLAQPTENYAIAGGLLAIGLLLYVVTWIYNRAIRARRTRFRHPKDLGRDRARPHHAGRAPDVIDPRPGIDAVAGGPSGGPGPPPAEQPLTPSPPRPPPREMP